MGFADEIEKLKELERRGGLALPALDPILPDGRKGVSGSRRSWNRRQSGKYCGPWDCRMPHYALRRPGPLRRNKVPFSLRRNQP
jgi:hypothetical protein